MLSKILTGKIKGKRSIGKLRRKMRGHIKLDLNEVSESTKNWLDSARDKDYWRALLKTVLNLQVVKAKELARIHVLYVLFIHRQVNTTVLGP